MAVETELKLRIAPGQIARLKRHVLLKKYQVARPVVRRLQNIYYDTPKLELHQSGMALRLRHAGRQWLQTLKGGGSAQAGLHQRNEWEVPVNRAALDFSATPGVEWDEHLRPSLRKKLQPVFVTDFSRSSRMLEFHGAQIELCLDQGEVRIGQRSTPICELELELKSGEPRQLFELALAILEIVPFELELVSKAEQGYRLLSGYSEHPVRATVPPLSGADTLADVLKKMIWSCLQHFQSNLHGAMTGDDAEYLHQMRVALRRLRVVLHMAGKICTDPVLNGLYKDVSDLCVALGRIREWDVFIAQTLQPICARMPGHAGLQVLHKLGERQRQAGYATLRDAAQSREIQRLLLRFSIRMNGDCWQPNARQQRKKGALHAQDFAARRLRKLARRFAQAGQALATADAAKLHALRIIAKKLRYSAEFFAGLYGENAAVSYLAALGEVQDVLGRINDIAVARRLLDGLAADAAALHDANALEAVTLSRGWIAHDLSDRVGTLKKTIQHFNKQAAFWKE
ncbi:MAG TPA: CHAD domain-containing protein [Gallionella sp.]|nr:CHAD domain-containing protein [Gallionella sp.]